MLRAPCVPLGLPSTAPSHAGFSRALQDVRDGWMPSPPRDERGEKARSGEASGVSWCFMRAAAGPRLPKRGHHQVEELAAHASGGRWLSLSSAPLLNLCRLPLLDVWIPLQVSHMSRAIIANQQAARRFRGGSNVLCLGYLSRASPRCAKPGNEGVRIRISYNFLYPRSGQVDQKKLAMQIYTVTCCHCNIFS